jgi:hypothetical protein
MAEQTNKTAKKTRRVGRSPAYPALDLKAALEKAEVLYEAEMRHAASFPTIIQHWGYSKESGPGRLAFAALKKFGLIELIGAGKGDARSARISDSAVKLILDKRPDSEGRLHELQAAALRPTAHRTWWDKYGGTLPSDANLTYQLRLVGFTEAGARDFLAEFRSTLAFARVDASTKIEGARADDNADQDAAAEDPMIPTPTESTLAPAGAQRTVGTPESKPSATGPINLAGPHVQFTLAGDNLLEVSLRSRVSRKEFERIQKIIELAEDSFVEPDGPA